MRLVPAGTSISLPLMVSLGMDSASDHRLELAAELFHEADVGADGAVVEGADRGAAGPARHVDDGVEILLAAPPLDDPACHLVDPPRGLAARRALATRLMGKEAREHHEGSGAG